MKKDKDKYVHSKKQAVQNNQDHNSALLKWSGISGMIILGIAIYSNTFQCPFHFDSYIDIVLTKFPGLTDLKGWWLFGNSRLVPYYSFALNQYFGHLNVTGYHYFNIAVHIINSFLVYWLTQLVFSAPNTKNLVIAKYRLEISLAAAFLFLGHPLATQSVTYVVQRIASMVTMFYLLSFGLYLKARISNGKTLTKIFLFAGSLLSAVLAMFTKENAFTLPFAIILGELILVNTKDIRKYLKDYRVIAAIVIILLLILIIPLRYPGKLFSSIAPSLGRTETLTPYNYLLTEFSVIVKYIQLLFVPVNQMVDYDFPVTNSILNWKPVASLLVLLAVFICGILAYRKNRIISFGIFWFFLTLSVESSFIPLSDVIFEHRTYLPSFGFFLVISSGIYIVFQNRIRVARLLFLVIILTYSVMTYQRNSIWESEISFWSDNIQKAPRLPRPYFARAYAYNQTGNKDAAISDYSKAIELNPKYAEAYFNRGNVYERLEKYSEAMNDYNIAIKFGNSTFLDVCYFNRGGIYDDLNQFDKSIADYSKSIELNSGFKDAYLNRGIAYGKLKKNEEAIIDFNYAIRLDRNFMKAYYNRGITYCMSNRWYKAINDFNKAIQLDPKFYHSFYYRGVAYSNTRQWEKAISDYSETLRQEPDNINAYRSRADIYYKLRNFASASTDYRNVLRIDPGNAEAQKLLLSANQQLTGKSLVNN